MDVVRILHSILAPYPASAGASGAERRSPEGTATTGSFSSHLDEALRGPEEGAKPTPSLVPAVTQCLEEAMEEVSGPVAGPPESSPWDPPVPNQSMAEAVLQATESAVLPVSVGPVGPVGPAAAEPTNAISGQAATPEASAAAVTHVATKTATKASTTTSGAWAPTVYRGTGATGMGIGGSDADALASIQLKFAYYTDPDTYGVTNVGPEGRMFQEAVRRGHIPNTVEGLGTLLTYLGQGAFAMNGTPGRPAEATAFFDDWFSSPASLP